MDLSQYKTLDEKERAIRKTILEREIRTKDQKITVGQLDYVSIEPTYTLFEHIKNACFETRCIEIDHHAESQLLSRLGIPVAYYNRCGEKLKEENFVYWKNNFRNRVLLLRWIDNRVRAIFSEKFSSDLDDIVLFPVVLKALREACTDASEHTLSIKTFRQESDFTLLRATYNNEKVFHNETYYFAGVSVVNSEVGKSSIWIRPTIHCSNAYSSYNFIDKSREGAISVRHVGNLKADRIHQAIINAKYVASAGIYQLLEADKQIIHNPIEEVDQLVKKDNSLTQRLSNIIEEEYKDKETVTKLQLAKSMLEAVRELPLFQRHLAQQDVGRYLDLFSSTHKRVKSICDDLQTLNQIDMV